MDRYDVEAIVSVDGRGQVVLPKEVRVSLGLEAGSKLAVVVMRQGDAPCCISLMPVGALEDSVREVLNPTTQTEGA
jgi:antitoxin PrlF